MNQNLKRLFWVLGAAVFLVATVLIGKAVQQRQSLTSNAARELNAPIRNVTTMSVLEASSVGDGKQTQYQLHVRLLNPVDVKPTSITLTRNSSNQTTDLPLVLSQSPDSCHSDSDHPGMVTKFETPWFTLDGVSLNTYASTMKNGYTASVLYTDNSGAIYVAPKSIDDVCFQVVEAVGSSADTMKGAFTEAGE